MLNFGILHVEPLIPVDPEIITSDLVVMECGCELVYLNGEWFGVCGLCIMHAYTRLLAGVPQSAN